MVYVKMVNKRKFTYIIEARLNASASQSNKSGKAITMSKFDYIFAILALIGHKQPCFHHQWETSAIPTVNVYCLKQLGSEFFGKNTSLK